MFLIKFLFWLLTLPFRMIFFVLGLGLWVLTLPLRIVFGVLGLIGFGRILQLGIVGGVGYFFYRLISEPPTAEAPGLSKPEDATTLKQYPST